MIIIIVIIIIIIIIIISFTWWLKCIYIVAKIKRILNVLFSCSAKTIDAKREWAKLRFSTLMVQKTRVEKEC